MSTNLTVGQVAPSFTLPDQDGKLHSLESYRGKYVLVYFYPKDNTPGCTKEACSLRDAHPDLSTKNVVVLGISPDSPKSHQGFITKQALPFTLLSDPELTSVKAYGAWGTKSMYGKEYEGLMRWSFLIDPQGQIAHIWTKVDTAKHGQEVLKVMEGR